VSALRRSLRSDVPSTWLTPRPARVQPIHRWLVFPHSFAPELVNWLICELRIEKRGSLLDPFCGAGTTLVEGEQHGFSPVGVDLLPLAVLASRAKLVRPSSADVLKARTRAVRAARAAPARTPTSRLLKRAFTPTTYGRLVAGLDSASGAAADCVRLATLSIAPRFSSLVADGGWLRESPAELPPRLIPDVLDDALSRMEEDVAEGPAHRSAQIHRADARALPLADDSVDAVITSPPYPNRHDYTRVFAVELELGFALGESVKQLRYSALRSHPEARPPANSNGYKQPGGLSEEVSRVAAQHSDPRIPRMLEGYFNDLYLVLRELGRVVRRDGVIAFVVGNAQYCGVPIPVEDHLVELARRSGFRVLDVMSLRMRGNSAQQMAAYGRRPSQESAVVLGR
jgi:DNA modification methylase